MWEISKILVPVDFSECAWAAARQAAFFAQQYGASVDVLHVWEAPPYIDPEAKLRTSGRDQLLSEFVHTEISKQMKELLDALEQQGITARCRIETGDPCQRILSVADSEGFDLVVMGTHGRTGLAHLLLGSIAERVVRTCRVPVLTVRPKKRKQRESAAAHAHL